MPHNPITSRSEPGRLDFGFVVPKNAVGVLYQGQKFVRLLAPGEGITGSERTSRAGPVIYIVDRLPHSLQWRLDLPLADPADRLSATVHLRYRVEDAQRVVDEHVSDTEAEIRRVLEPVLRKTSRLFKLVDHAEVQQALEDAIAGTDVQHLTGLALLDPAQVEVNLSDADLREVENRRRVGRKLQRAQQAQITATLPSQEPQFGFTVTVNMRFAVQNPKEVTPEDLPEMVEMLWPQLVRKLRRASHNYTVEKLAEADEALQEALDELIDKGVQGFGLTVLDADVSTDLEPSARQRFIELADIDHQSEKKRRQAQGMAANTDYYLNLVRGGSMHIAAAAAANGDLDLEALYARLDGKERERMQLQLSLLDKLRSDDAKDERHDADVSIRILDNLASEFTGQAPPANPALVDRQRRGGSSVADEEDL